MSNDRRRSRSFWPRRRSLWILFLLLPALTVMTLFVVWPLLSALRFAFYDFNGLLPSHFIGLENFRKVLFEEPYSGWTYNAFWHNVIVFVSLMIFENGTAFLVAFALLKGLPGHRIHQVIVFLPVVLSSVIVGFLWKLFLNPIFGLVNGALALVHIQGPAWLGNENTALGSIIFANIWHWLGFPTLVLLAGMQRISAEVIEAARLDGAGDYVLLRRIIWPLIAPSVTIVCILTFIGSFNWFEIPYVMAGLTGSPGGSTDVLGLYFYRTAFGSVTNGIQDFGQGSALAVLMFIFVAGFSFVALRFLRRREIQL
ncbi:sugar ABC transporter permease [Neorhizobium sp. P12A]|uniref:carbohydrate ABC transporter permease n=1 Tax=Rhizobium/Agrobacterium group TaxID=227290 RepID=UPI0010522361|nr:MULTISPECIES: sugar ABC transporter permease [Rhizobium/Agrobacterium group]KAA0697840.1 sugar ABC transporter permease [Neorhizobium sp. P12A]TCR87957.1 carbohydrate ABC transporter membrane protein 1 (CUT1 family) [Rhizobium sp. BK376]